MIQKTKGIVLRSIKYGETSLIVSVLTELFGLQSYLVKGFRINDEYSESKHYLDLEEGTFVEDQPKHPHYLQDREAAAVNDILKIMQPSELELVPLNQESRRRILHALEEYYLLHIPEFGML